LQEQSKGIGQVSQAETQMDEVTQQNSALVEQAAVLQHIWSEVLRSDVCVDDNFFELGGNSLYAVRIAVAIREGGLGNLPMRELYLRQTVRGIASYLSEMRSAR
jgi:hypothetical protein